jgi:hypothetical protein
MNLALVSPREIQVVRVPESPELRLAAKRNRDVFNLSTASVANPASAVGNPAFRVLTASLR